MVPLVVVPPPRRNMMSPPQEMVNVVLNVVSEGDEGASRGPADAEVGILSTGYSGHCLEHTCIVILEST